MNTIKLSTEGRKMPTPPPKPVSEHIAYEWGDPKNTEYLDWLLDQEKD